MSLNEIVLNGKDRQTSKSIKVYANSRPYIARKPTFLVLLNEQPFAVGSSDYKEVHKDVANENTKSVYSYTIPSHKTAANLLKIEKYGSYRHGWNGYEGLPFSAKLISDVKSALLDLPDQPHVSPTGRGSIQFDYSKGDDSLEIEIFEDRIEILEVVDDRENEYNTTIDQLRQHIDQFYAS